MSTVRRTRKFSSLFPLILIGLLFISGCSGKTPTEERVNGASSFPKSLLVYCSAGLKSPVEEICQVFNNQNKELSINTSIAGTSQLNSQILLTKKGDVYVVSDAEELKPLQDKGLIAWEESLVYHTPVLAVPKGNPGGIEKLTDLAQQGIRLGLGDTDAVPIGKIADRMLEENKLLEAVNKNVVVRTATVNELLVYLSSGQVDAAIVWEENCTALEDTVEVVKIPELEKHVKATKVVLLSCSQEEELARRFAEFVASPQAMEIWEKHGYRPIDG